jgi:hypothetical protein
MEERVYEQLELFPLTEAEQLKIELDKFKKELANLRRGLFARHNTMEALIVELRKDVDMMMCQQKDDLNICNEA